MPNFMHFFSFFFFFFHMSHSFVVVVFLFLVLFCFVFSGKVILMPDICKVCGRHMNCKVREAKSTILLFTSSSQ